MCKPQTQSDTEIQLGSTKSIYFLCTSLPPLPPPPPHTTNSRNNEDHIFQILRQVDNPTLYITGIMSIPPSVYEISLF